MRRTSSLPERVRAHSVAFDSPEGAIEAVRVFRGRGYNVVDVHTPFAVHGMDDALGLTESRLPFATFAGGVLGLSIGLGFQLWTHGVDWPLNIGGKTFIAWPALIPISFETTVLLAAFATVGALLYLGRLFPRAKGGLPHTQPGSRVTNDHFVLLIAEEDGAFSVPDFRHLCAELGAAEVVEGWRVL